MLNQSAIQLGTTVSFDVYPFAIFGTSIKNAKVLSIIDGPTAQQLGHDVIALHVQVWPTLPAGTVPNGYDKYHYLLVKLASGNKAAIGLPWIKEESFKIELTKDIVLRLNGVTPDKQNEIIRALSAIEQPIASIDEV